METPCFGDPKRLVLLCYGDLKTPKCLVLQCLGDVKAPTFLFWQGSQKPWFAVRWAPQDASRIPDALFCHVLWISSLPNALLCSVLGLERCLGLT
eukprot:3125140-Amphidinium_carterae.1